MSEHTPGPWRLDGEYHGDMVEDGYHFIDAGDGFHSDDRDTGFSISGCISHENARLISAAPDILAALKAICSEFSQGHPLIVSGRAAIAKAEPKS
jgi:hypothetical protein